MSDAGTDCDGGSTTANDTLAETGCDWSATAPSTAVVEAIATLEETDPVALSANGGPTLYDYVDPDALDGLVGDEGGDGLAVTLAVGEYVVRINGNEMLVSRSESETALRR